MDGSSPWGENHGKKPFFYVTKNPETSFAIILSCILKDYCASPIKLGNKIKGKSSVGDVGFIFSRVICNLHGIIVVTKNIEVKERVFPDVR